MTKKILRLCACEEAYHDIDSENDPVAYIMDVCIQYFSNFVDLYECGIRALPRDIFAQMHELLKIYGKSKNFSHEASKYIDDLKSLLSNVTILNDCQM